jgi:hypothetical protein
MPEIESREFSKRLGESLLNIRLGRVKDTHGWIYKVD